MQSDKKNKQCVRVLYIAQKLLWMSFALCQDYHLSFLCCGSAKISLKLNTCANFSRKIQCKANLHKKSVRHLSSICISHCEFDYKLIKSVTNYHHQPQPMQHPTYLKTSHIRFLHKILTKVFGFFSNQMPRQFVFVCWLYMWITLLGCKFQHINPQHKTSSQATKQTRTQTHRLSI